MAKRKPRFEISTITSIYEKRVPDRVKELAAKHINQESLRLITRISEDMRKRIQKILRKGEREGRSVSAIASRLLKTGLDKGVFRSARQRVWLIARTELHRARQQAAFDVYRANKILQVKWVSICDDRLCKKCRKRHNKIFNINRLRTPPPLHPRCRCRCIPKGMKADIKPKKQDKQKYRYVITLQKAAYPGNMGFAEIYKFYQGATQEAIRRYENFLNRGRIRAAVAELERFVGYELHPSIWRRLRGGKYETVHRLMTKSKRVFVPQSPHHKAYTRMDPRTKHEPVKLSIEDQTRLKEIEVHQAAIVEELETLVGIDPRYKLQRERADLEGEKHQIYGKAKDELKTSTISDTKAQKDWEASLTDEQKKAIKIYLSAPYDSSRPKEIQHADAYGNGQKEALEIAKQIRSAIDLSPKETADVYRGLTLKLPEVGQVFSQNTFASWSRDVHIARGYAVSNPGDIKVIFHVKAPVVDVGRLGPYSETQKEVWVDKGDFRVKSVERDSRYHNTYDVELEFSESLQKARPYVRFRNRRLEHVRGYAGKVPLANLSPSERVEMFLDPARPDVKKAKEVALAVAQAGGRALYVGGCVRDALLGRVSKDIDIDVYGLPNEKIKEISSKLGTVNLVGRQFPVFKLSGPGMDEPIDICLPRRDSKVGEGHAKGFIAEADPFMSVKEAARRRDLTINTLAYDPLTKEVIDEYEGLKDIEDRKLRVTDPETFGDDSLRVLRVMQFAARLGFTPDVQLVKICRAIDLSDISRERIFEEMEKLLLKSKYPSIGLGLIPALGISKIMPEIDALRGVKQDPEWHKEGTVWKHTLMVVDAAAKLRGKFKNNKDKMALMLAALCHDLGKPMTTEVREGRITTYGHDDAGVEPTRQLLGRISNDSEIQGKVESLVREHMKPTFFHHDKVPDSAIRRLAKKVDIPLLVALSMADKLGRGGPTPKLESERWLLKKYKELKLDQPKALDPVVLGRHLIQLGMKPGPAMGGVLKQIYEAQLEGKFATPEDGVAYAQQMGWLAKGQVYEVDDLMKTQVFVPAHQSEGHMVQGYYRDDPREKHEGATPPPLIHVTDPKELGQIYQKEYLDAEIKDPQGNKITFSQSNFLHITKLDMGTLDKYRSERMLWIKDIIQNPDLIVKDKRDPQARLFIKWYQGEPYLFVCRVQGNQFHSVTAYPLESRGKLEALLRQEKIYSRPGFELKKSEIINVKGHLTRTKSGKLTPVRPYVQTRQQLREQLKQDKKTAAKKHGVESESLHFEGPFLSQAAGKYIYQWTIHQPGHPSDGSTVSGYMYDIPKIQKGEGDVMKEDFALVVDPNKLRKKLAELKKSKLIGKKVPVKVQNAVKFYKAVRGGYLVKGQGRMAKLGDKIMAKGIPAQVTALGKDGLTARDAQARKYQLFYKDVELIRSHEELRK